MAYCGFIVEIKELTKHPNADRLLLTELRGCQVIVGLDTQVGEIGVMFPAEGQLNEEFARKNGLLREKDAEGNPIGNGYLDPKKRNICTLKLRGERSEGIFMPLTALADYTDISKLKVGDEITILNGVEICCKYIPVARNAAATSTNLTRKKEKVRVYFPEHIDTKQVKFCWNEFKIGDIVTISEKLEGTSGRSAYLSVEKPQNWLQKLLCLPPKRELKYFCGSRRVTLNADLPQTGEGFYGDNSFRIDIHNRLKPFLKPNMEIFYEIVGYLPTLTPIMGSISTKPLKDKEFTKKYGDNLIFHYGCEVGTYDFYIYRIVELDGDDIKYEYSTCQIMDWCKKNGFKHVPYLSFYTINSEEDLEFLPILVDKLCDGESTLAPHWREGCVLRRENEAFRFNVYKHKNFTYRLLKNMFVSELEVNDNMSQDILEEM